MNITTHRHQNQNNDGIRLFIQVIKFKPTAKLAFILPLFTLAMPENTENLDDSNFFCYI